MPKLKTQTTEPKTAGDLRDGNIKSQLFSFVERYERLQEERQALGEDQREVMDEAKGLGFDTAIIRKVIQRRKMDSASRQEADALLELYEEAITKMEAQQLEQSKADGE